MSSYCKSICSDYKADCKDSVCLCAVITLACVGSDYMQALRCSEVGKLAWWKILGMRIWEVRMLWGMTTQSLRTHAWLLNWDGMNQRFKASDQSGSILWILYIYIYMYLYMWDVCLTAVFFRASHCDCDAIPKLWRRKRLSVLRVLQHKLCCKTATNGFLWPPNVIGGPQASHTELRVLQCTTVQRKSISFVVLYKAKNSNM